MMFQVRVVYRTWNANSLAVSRMMFQVRVVYRTWRSGTPTGRSVPRPLTLRCVNILAPGTPTRWLSDG